jgi:aspartate carbamoyltransferase
MRHILDVASLSKDVIYTILSNAKQFKNFHTPKILLNEKIISTMFFEPSTRANMSFQCAAYKLGANVLAYNDIRSSSKKGESLEDTVKSMSQYADALVIKHPESGAIRRCAKISDVPLINAGDGNSEHPTQALLDVFTIQEYFSENKGFNIAFVGDLKNRSALHSTVELLDKLYNNIQFSFVSHEGLQLESEFYPKNNKYHIHTSINAVTSFANIIYMTRIQREREGTSKFRSCNIITKSFLEMCDNNLIIMHPFPRNEEIDPEVDNDNRCKFMEQMKNGVYVRMSILDYVLNKN